MQLYGLKAFRPELKGIIRDLRVAWLLEELERPYELIQLDPSKEENKTPEYLKLNPMGKVPTLVDGDFAIYESAAICEYLAEKHKKFIPSVGTPQYYICKQWNYFMVANVEPQCARLFSSTYFMENKEEAQVVRRLAMDILPRFLNTLEKHLETRTYMMGDEFTMTDILLVSSLTYAKPANVLKDYPVLTRYFERVTLRPAFQVASNKNG